MTPILFAAVLMAAQSAQPAAQAPEDIGRGYYLYLQGQRQEKADDATGAIESYRQASLALPRSAEIRYQLAQLYARMNQLAEAQREAATALGLNPDDRETHRLLGGIQTAIIERPNGSANRALVDEAIGHFEKALADGASDPPVELALSSLYLRAEAAPKAIALLQKVLRDLPDYPAARRMLVRAYEMAGESAKAAEAREALAKAPPDQTEDRARQAARFEQAGRWAEAAALWAEVVREDPGAAIYFTEYATALANTGRYPQARAVLLQATREGPLNVEAWYLLSLVEARAGNAAPAEEAAKKIVAIDPADGRGPLGLARARAAASDYRGVVDVLSPRVAAPRGDDVESGLFAEMAGELSTALGRINQHKRAAEMLEGARKRVPKDQHLLFRLGAAYEQGKKFDAAERAFRELIAANDKHADALNYLGYMLADRGQKLPEALEFIKRAVAAEDDNPAFLDSLGWAYFKLGQLDNAKAPLERAAGALPRVSVIQDHLGDLYLQMKRYADAVAAFERALSGDRDGIDAPAITKKRDRARSLVGKS